MKRYLFTALVLCLYGAARAQSDYGFTVINPGYGEYFLATAMSQNGKYVAGWCGSGVGTALYDVESGDIYHYDYASEMSAVTDDGMMIGYGVSDDMLLAYNPITGDKIVDSSVVDLWGKGCTPDGSLIVGVYYDYAWNGYACYWPDGTCHKLPQPDAEDIGFGDEDTGDWGYYYTVAMDISADGRIIVGNVWDWYLDAGALIWTLDDSGEYVLDPICKGLIQTDWGYDKPYYQYQATAISANGKYVAMYLQDQDGAYGSSTYMGRYDMETGVMTTATYSGNCTPTRIANDGTIIGYTGNQDSQSRTALIWEKDGEIELLADKYPEVTAFKEWDADQDYNFAADITPDGRYICGGGWHYFEEDGESAYARYASWVFDREQYAAATGIHDISASTPSTDKSSTQYYSPDGKALSAPQKGLNIIKSNGKTIKTIVK